MLAWKGEGPEKPTEIFYPLVRGKIRDPFPLKPKQANIFSAAPNSA